jgi:hypothetical protein
VTTRMDPVVRDEWVRRLRSGDYPQGGGQLRSPLGRFCCLGVLCEVARERGIVTYDPATSAYTSVADPDEGDYTGQLPPTVVRWAGLPEDVTWASDPFVQGGSLSRWNDRGTPFADIATMIEEEL